LLEKEGVRGMVRNIVMTFLIMVSQRCFGQIVLSEVMFDPDGSEQTDEFIEIWNSSNTDSYDLAGWQIGDGSGEDVLADAGKGMILSPGQYGLILDPDYFENSVLYDYLIPETALVLTIDGPTLGSGGLSNSQPETIILFDPDHSVVSRYVYSTGNSSGHSDEKLDLMGSDGAGNWMDSAVLNGTPGFRNSVSGCTCAETVSLTISPNPFSPDSDGIDDMATISYHFSMQPSHVTLRIFDVCGRCIRNLLGAALSGHDGWTTWDGRDRYGRLSGMGIYIVYIESLSGAQGTAVSARTTVVLAGSL
jgi:hypothetical protein